MRIHNEIHLISRCSRAYELKMKIIVINVFQKPVTEDGCENTRRTAVHVTRYQKL